MEGEAERKTIHYKSSTWVKTHGNKSWQNLKLNFIRLNHALDPNTYVSGKMLDRVLLDLPTCRASSLTDLVRYQT
jgi:hypothetical protein